MNSTQGEFGHQFADGVRAALEGVDAEVLDLDDQDNTAIAKRKANSIVQDPRVVLVIGHSASATTIAADSIYAESELPLIAPIATMDDLFAGKTPPKPPTVFRLPPPNRFQAKAIARYLTENGIARVLLLFRADGAYSESMRQNVRSEWTGVGDVAAVEISSSQRRPELEPDDELLARGIGNSSNALKGAVPSKLAIVVATYYRDAIHAVKAVRIAEKEGLIDPNTQILLTDGALHPRIGRGLGSDLEGADMVFVGPGWKEFDPDKRIFEAYVRIHEKGGHPQRPDQPQSYERMWPSFMEYGYLAGRIAADAINVAKTQGDVSKVTILHALQSGKFATDLPIWPQFSFRDDVMPGVMEPATFMITIYRVVRTEQDIELDSTWLGQVKRYTDKDLK